MTASHWRLEQIFPPAPLIYSRIVGWVMIYKNDMPERSIVHFLKTGKQWKLFSSNIMVNKLGIWLNSVSRVLDPTLSNSIVCN